MEAKRSRQVLLWTALAALFSQNLVIPAMSRPSFDDQKNYYPPDPNAHPPPAVSYSPPPHAGGHASPTPSHGTPSHGTPSHGTPSHGTPSHGTPSHGTPSYGGTPPANCGNPPSGGHHHTPSPPTGGGYYHSPPTTPTPTPTTPTPVTPTPTTPTTPYPTTPTTPTIVSPPSIVTPPTPTTPIDPGTSSPPSITIPSPPFSFPPGFTIPSPPFSFDPSSPPFTCTYWRNHPTLIWGLVGWFGTVGNAFSLPSTPGVGSSMNLLQALSNTRTDGLGELYREGTAALLNSMAHTRFPYTTNQVRDSFVAAISSNRAAGAQARLFKLANEGRLKPRS